MNAFMDVQITSNNPYSDLLPIMIMDCQSAWVPFLYDLSSEFWSVSSPIVNEASDSISSGGLS